MTDVRQLKLKNKYGQEFDFMRKDAFLYDIKGFGWGVSADLMEVGNDFMVIDEKIQTKNPSGTLAVASYDVMEEFRSFVQTGGLTLCYKPNTNIDWRYLDVHVEFETDEIKYDTGYLHCPVTFTRHSQWYESSVLYRPSLSIDRDTGKIYDYQYGIDNNDDMPDYAYRYQDFTSGNISIYNGRIPSFFKITYIGPVHNPTYILYKDDVIYKKGKIICNIPSTHKLVINTEPTEAEIFEYDDENTPVQDCYGYQDWTTEVMFSLPPGESRMVLTQDDESLPIAYLEVHKRV